MSSTKKPPQDTRRQSFRHFPIRRCIGQSWLGILNFPLQVQRGTRLVREKSRACCSNVRRRLRRVFFSADVRLFLLSSLIISIHSHPGFFDTKLSRVRSTASCAFFRRVRSLNDSGRGTLFMPASMFRRLGVMSFFLCPAEILSRPHSMNPAEH